MAIKFRDDHDLKFLQFCENEDLGILVEVLKGKKDDERISEELTADEGFKACNLNFRQVWDVIAGELQLFGGDSVVNAVRGSGVVYKELLTDVCDKLKVNYNKDSELSVIETNMLMKVLEKSLEKMTPEQIQKLAEEFDIKGKGLNAGMFMMALQAAINAGGFKAYQLSMIVANSIVKTLIGRGLPLAANAALVRGLGLFAGPIGWAISALLTVPMLTGPAYRVTTPACIIVAYLRQKSMAKDHF